MAIAGNGSWRCIILTGVIVWFVIDSAGSIVAGAPFNAVMNVGFLLMFEIPILWPKSNNHVITGCIST